MMIRSLLLVTGLLFSFPLLSKEYNVTSPDGHIILTVNTASGVNLSVSYDGKQLLSGLEPGLRIEGLNLQTGVTNPKVSIREHTDTLVPVVSHKNSVIPDHYREVILTFRDGWGLICRVYDDGIAYRLTTSLRGEVKVTAENFGFTLPAGSQSWYPLEKGFMSHNEQTFHPAMMDTITEKHLASLPALFRTSGVDILLTEADIDDYPGMWITGDSKGGITAKFPYCATAEKARNDRNVYVTERADYLAKTGGARFFPWRVFIITPDDAGLVESDMVYKLAPPCRIKDTGWIKPGKVAWDWYNANNLYGVNFRAGLNNETYKYYIDFASDNGIEYVILDEGWYNLGDVLDVAEGFDIGELCDYAAEKNVGIILWVVWKSLYDKMDEALDQFERWGVKGIKVDFMQRDDQWMVNFYHLVASRAADHRMLVDFHGCFKPDGMERTWPNVITREGVKGLEHNKWSAESDPEHNLIIPFTRMVAGPMDYTPGAMVNMQKRDFNPVFYRPASQGTRVHQMAMYGVYESPLQMMADSPSNYKRNQECATFIAAVPVTWDETRVLSAVAGDYIVIARRKGDSWYLSAMTDWTPRNLMADLSFIPVGEYLMEVFCDGINADKFGEDYRHFSEKVSSGDTVKIEMAPGGGWIARITALK